MSVVSHSRPRLQPGSDTELTPADLLPRQTRAIDMGCHLEVFSHQRPGVSRGVQVWAFGAPIVFAIAIGFFWWATH